VPVNTLCYCSVLSKRHQQHCSQHCCLISTTQTTFIHRQSVIYCSAYMNQAQRTRTCVDYYWPDIWNSLPHDICKITDTNTFKCHPHFYLGFANLPFTVSCFSKIQIFFTFLVLTFVLADKGALNGCVCVRGVVS